MSTSSGRTPGPTDIARDSGKQYSLLSQNSVQCTPGPCGCNDNSEPFFHLLDSDSTVLVKKRIDWEPDPHSLLLEEHVNPYFADAARKAVDMATFFGRRVRITEVYRTPERSAQLYDEYQAATKKVKTLEVKLKAIEAKIKAAKSESEGVKLNGDHRSTLNDLKEARRHVTRAAPKWQSAHNYGLAMDVLCYSITNKGKLVELPGDNVAYAKFAGYAAIYGIMWPSLKNDRGHFEFHPDWAKAASGAFLVEVHNWALEAMNWQLSKAITPMLFDGVPTVDTVSKFNELPDGPVAEVGPVYPSETEGPTVRVDEFDVLRCFWWAAGAGGDDDGPSQDFLAEHPVPEQK